MARPQNSFRGLFAKSRGDIGSQNLTYNSTALILSGGVRISNKANGQITANATGVIFPGQARLGASKYVGANSTGYTFTAGAAKPSTRTAGYNWTFITNSTGVSGIALRTTGTTWKFVNVTTVLPTRSEERRVGKEGRARW